MADTQAVPLAVYLETWADDINKNSGKSVDADQLRKIAGWIRSEAAENERLRDALREASDLLAERIYGSPARSPGHNARLVMERALSEQEGK